MTTLKLEVGKSYRTRDGGIVKINNDDGHPIYPFSDTSGKWYTQSGQFSRVGSSRFDLISEWQDEPTPVTYTQADVQPLVEALESIVSKSSGWGYTDDAVYDIGQEASQALERFKGMK